MVICSVQAETIRRHNNNSSSIHSNVASPICQEGQSERTFLIFAFCSWFFIFFLIFSWFLANFLLSRAAPLPLHWLRYCPYTNNKMALKFTQRSERNQILLLTSLIWTFILLCSCEEAYEGSPGDVSTNGTVLCSTPWGQQLTDFNPNISM